MALAWRDTDSPYEAFTLVNQAVEAAKRTPATRPQANFINACLRRFLRERDALVLATDDDPVARWNHPAWWIARVRRDYPTGWEDILAANNGHAPMTLRVNARQTSRAAYLDALTRSGIDACAAKVGVPDLPDSDAIILTNPVPVNALPGFDQGMVSVQDAAAQLAAPLLLQVGTPPLIVLTGTAAGRQVVLPAGLAPMPPRGAPPLPGVLPGSTSPPVTPGAPSTP